MTEFHTYMCMPTDRRTHIMKTFEAILLQVTDIWGNARIQSLFQPAPNALCFLQFTVKVQGLGFRV